MNTNDSDRSLADAATFAGSSKRRPADVSLGDERTLGGDDARLDTVIDDIEVVDLEARYAIQGTLGQGGMGAVMLAVDTRLDRKVAIKRILGEAARSKTAIQRFLTEAKAIAALNHPNIVQIYDYGRAKDGPFLIMEYVDGGSVADRCKQGALPLDEAVSLACQLCDGLAKAHDAGIVHRDIKPANVLLNKDGLPKLTDFGLAKAESADHGMTMTGAVLGTPDFMPPEQRRDASEVDHRSDLWSLAATVYQMVTGRSPKIIRFDLLPAQLTKVLGKALEEEKEARYQSVREFRDALVGLGAAGRKSSAPADFEGVLQEGQCKACGTITTDLTRKFCRNPQCGVALRVACLKCATQIPVWDPICGECGGKQAALLTARRESFAAAQEEARALLAGFAFDEAIARARPLADEPHLDLAEFATWGVEFVASAMAERDRQRALGEERLHAAHAHLRAWDYPAAIQTIESIPASLRDAATVRLLEECGERRRESAELISAIASRIGRKEIDGLLPIVERALALRGDRHDLEKIRGQLAERVAGRIIRARAALAAGDAAAAAQALAGAAVEDLGTEARLLDQVARARAAEERLIGLVKDAKADGVVNADEAGKILEAGEQCLAVNPASEKAKVLVGQAKGIIEREAQQQLIRALTGQASVADTLKLPPLRNSMGMELKLLPAGTFTMGQAGGVSDETPHQVTLTKPFYLGVTEVTNAQWQAVMGSVPSTWKEADRPVEKVSWADAMEFCRKLSALAEERQAGREYRLPTEAEWEYACRAGTKTRYCFGDDEVGLGDFGWFNGNAGGETHPVGGKKPNAWGLFDMHGNVFEWCSDWYGEYPKGVASDPQGPSGGSGRVSRGGCWVSTARSCRSAFRLRVDAAFRDDTLGFRLALNSDLPGRSRIPDGTDRVPARRWCPPPRAAKSRPETARCQ
jgi:formylglycine-generating enzyme required for sulfatase activity